MKERLRRWLNYLDIILNYGYDYYTIHKIREEKRKRERDDIVKDLIDREEIVITFISNPSYHGKLVNQYRYYCGGMTPTNPNSREAIPFCEKMMSNCGVRILYDGDRRMVFHVVHREKYMLWKMSK